MSETTLMTYGIMGFKNIFSRLNSFFYKCLFLYQAYPIKVIFKGAARIAGHVNIRGNSGTVHIGKRIRIYGATIVFSDHPQSTLVFGDDIILEDGVTISPRTGNIMIGNNVFIGPYSIIQAYHGGDILICDDVMIAKGVSIFSSNHDMMTPPITYRREIGKPVRIEENVWIGADVVINAGVIIGKGAIIASGSVVTNDVLPYTVNVGIPCRQIKQYSFEKKEWVDA
jgi:acetyltransferase-like isoleucine patch superfamily enzyme